MTRHMAVPVGPANLTRPVPPDGALGELTPISPAVVEAWSEPPVAMKAGIVAKSRPGKIEVIGSSEGRDLRSQSLRFLLPRGRSRHRCFFPSKILCFHQEMDACI